MLIPVIPTFRKRRPKPRVKAVAPLTLISATWNSDDGVLSLTFNRAISMADLNPAAIRLKDGVTGGVVYGPYPPVFVQGGTTLVMSVIDIEPYAGSNVLLTVTPGNGIMAVEDGAEWAGVTDLPVPFP